MSLPKNYFITSDKNEIYNKIIKPFESYSKNFKNINFVSKIGDSWCQGRRNNVLYYSSEVYLILLDFIDKVLHPKWNEGYKCVKNNYTTEIIFELQRPLLISPPYHFLSIAYYIKDSDSNIIFRLRIGAFLSTETDELELYHSYHSIKNGFSHLLSNYINYGSEFFKDHFKVSLMIPCNMYYYQVLNLICPEGLDPTRKSFQEDINKLKEWSEGKPYNLVFDDKGIIISRNKKIDLPIEENIPEISSYICHHNQYSK
jgi:hypothetical protein